MLLLPILDGLQTSFMLGMDALSHNFWRHAELKTLFCHLLSQESLETGPVAFDERNTDMDV